MQKEGRLYLNKDGIVACNRRDEDKVLYKYNAIVLPQLYQTELLFRSHDQMGHQGIDKVYQRILKRFEWPGKKKVCDKWVTACLSFQQVKDPRKLRFLLQSIESSEFNELVQIDHQKICMTDSGYNQVLVMIDHFTKYAEAVPCITASAEETCDHLINTWIARHGCPMTFQSDNGTAFVGELTKEIMRRSQVAQAHSTTYLKDLTQRPDPRAFSYFLHPQLRNALGICSCTLELMSIPPNIALPMVCNKFHRVGCSFPPRSLLFILLCDFAQSAKLLGTILH